MFPEPAGGPRDGRELRPRAWRQGQDAPHMCLLAGGCPWSRRPPGPRSSCQCSGAGSRSEGPSAQLSPSGGTGGSCRDRETGWERGRGANTPNLLSRLPQHGPQAVPRSFPALSCKRCNLGGRSRPQGHRRASRSHLGSPQVKQIISKNCNTVFSKDA